MTDWVYVIGEGSYNQDWQILNQETNEPIPLSGTITMFIKKSDFTAAPQFPVSGVQMSIETVDGVQVARLAVSANQMPNEAAIYLFQIKIDAAQTFKTFTDNLRVLRSLTT